MYHANEYRNDFVFADDTTLLSSSLGGVDALFA